MGVTPADRMDGATGGRAEREWALPAALRWILALRAPPLAIGAGAGLAYLALAAVWCNATGYWQGFRIGGVPFWVHDEGGRADLVYALTVALLPAMLIYLARGAERDIDDIRPRLRTPVPAAALRREVLEMPRRVWWWAIALAVGLCVFDLALAYTLGNMDPVGPAIWTWVVLRELGSDLLFLGIFGWALGVAVNLSRLARERVALRLMEPGDGAPFVRNGLRIALCWMLIWAIWWPIMFDAEGVSDAWYAVASGIFGVGISLAAIALVVPTRGVHDGLRRAKDEALKAVHGEIEAARAALQGGGSTATEAAVVLPGLLAWEARVHEVSEWPFDVRTLGRLGLYVLIPLASWVGGALVERLVDAVLD